ncbi:hypothetical protein NDU88_003450 [Pleurodeles waltl]|uniref:Uncharacterized protein n=1 Tax=Pleurodeles waltl TaxID=8319 RepID=A0AAV7WTN7_PLEWA|nr:hypothetical protein NDU88_003450 [Pleurodeles waltl]
MNGLRARDARRKVNADRGAGTGDEQPEDPGRRQNSGETQKLATKADLRSREDPKDENSATSQEGRGCTRYGPL